MATTHLIPVGEYLASTYRPDVDYVDGHIEERHLGDYDHSDVQTQLVFLLRLHEKEWHVHAFTEMRVQVGPSRFRVPDLCLMNDQVPRSTVVQVPPMLCIEVLSPRDSVRSMRRRSQDYFDMGVPVVWMLDPATRTAYICSKESIFEQKEGTLRLPGSAVQLALQDIFATLDRNIP